MHIDKYTLETIVVVAKSMKPKFGRLATIAREYLSAHGNLEHVMKWQ